MLFGRAHVNIFLVFVPLGIVTGVLSLQPEMVFWFNWLAVVPLAPIITTAILRLSGDIGQIKGGLVKAILCNTTEIIICMVAIINDHKSLVPSVIIGSVLSYSLLFLGCSYLVASVGKESISYNKKQTSVTSALVMVVSISLVIPTILALADRSDKDAREHSLFLSRGTAIVIFIQFIAYLIFRFRTHKSVFMIRTTDENTAARGPPSAEPLTFQPDLQWLVLYLGASACVIVCSTYMIGSLKAATESIHVTDSFIGVVLLPLAGNVSKSFVIIGHARRGHIDKAIRLLMSNILDALLFITPFLVLFSWIIGISMELEFNLFQAIIFVLAIVVMQHLLQPGKVTYFEGTMLIGTYIIIAAALFVVR